MEYLIDKSKAELIVLVKKLQLEIEHQKSADLFKRLFDAIPDAVFITRIGGENPGRILDVNIAAERQTGYDRKELLAMNILNDLATGVIMEATLKEREGELENRESIRFTEKKRRKDGSEYWTDVLTIMINFNNVNEELNSKIEDLSYDLDEAVREINNDISGVTRDLGDLRADVDSERRRNTRRLTDIEQTITNVKNSVTELDNLSIIQKAREKDK